MASKKELLGLAGDRRLSGISSAVVLVMVILTGLIAGLLNLGFVLTIVVVAIVIVATYCVILIFEDRR